MCEYLQTRTENLDRSIIDKWSIVLHSHFSFVPGVTAEYKVDCPTKRHGDEKDMVIGYQMFSTRSITDP